MNAYCGSRSSRPAGLFSFSGPAASPSRRRAQTWRSLFLAPCALDGLPVRLRRRHLREASVTFGLSKTPPHHSAASANVTLVIPRVADLGTAFTNNPRLCVQTRMLSLILFLPLLVAACTAASSSDGPETVVSRLVALLNDPQPDVRRTAALSLGKIAHPESGSALIPALRDADPLVRRYSAWALGSLGEHAAHNAGSALVPLLGDSSPEVAMAAAEAIGKIGASQPVVDLLTHTLRDPSVNTRRAAVKSLAWLESASAYAVLVGALKDPDAQVRQGAAAALGELGDRRALVAMEDRLLHDPAIGVRSEAAFRLGKLGDHTAMAALRAAANGDPESKVRGWAAWAIEQLASAGEPGLGT